MNLRNVSDYSIGLDIGTGSVGWAVVDGDGNLCHFKKRPAWGSRLFSSANQASVARAPRGQRRRYVRRRWRLNLLQGLFSDEMEKVDQEFFVRLNHSALTPEDRGCKHPIFNSSDFTEAEYYQKFPTVYHLRYWLMTTEDKADIRLVYLALHNIVKYRGNFIQQDNSALSAKDASTEYAARVFEVAFAEWCEKNGLVLARSEIASSLRILLEDRAKKRGEIREGIEGLLTVELTADAEIETAAARAMVKEISKAIVGYKADFQKIFFSDCEDAAFALDDSEKVEAYLAACPEDGIQLFEAMQGLYSSYVLTGILTHAGLSLSKMAAYEKYGEDLAMLKGLVRDYAPGSYDEFFRGDRYPDNSDYDARSAKGYTRYNLGPNKKGSGAKTAMGYDEFRKEVERLFSGTDAIGDARYLSMMNDFAEEKFLRRLKTSDNGQIPFQLHLEEMHAILENQGIHFPFLIEREEQIESLVSFRIPYYVGPLPQKGVGPDQKQASRFAWATRYEDKVHEDIRPWNWEEIVDKHASAQAFIERMTGNCTYLEGETVLPKCSLLYERFCVLNELAGAHYSQDGDDQRRFAYCDRAGILEDLFARKKKVTYKSVEDWMKQHARMNVHVSGGQGETAFESQLSSYIFFTKDIFKSDSIPEEYIPMVEEIILWNTLFEDRAILREEIVAKYGDVLDAVQIKKICKKRFTGWGRLSRKFLSGMMVPTDNGKKSIMDILEEGNQTNGRIGQAMVLMEILHDDCLGFQSVIDEYNRKTRDERGVAMLEDLPGSPALRRPINQALKIVEEIASIAGHAPASIYIEVTREDDVRKKGKRTSARYKNLEEALKAFGAEAKETLGELKSFKNDLGNDRLALYFMQNGKSLYSGRPLDISNLSLYQVDHIIPQSYMKDDSLENKALVYPGENQQKADDLLIDPDIRRKMAAYWKSLRVANLIGEKKFRNLMCSSISEGRIKGFIARQIVETSQTVKLVQQMLQERYPDTAIKPVKASLSSQLREQCGFVKIRELNNYHHAHDAYRACQLGRFIDYRFPNIYENPVAYAKSMKRYMKISAALIKTLQSRPDTAPFIVRSFMTSGFDEKTGEIFDDAWNAGFEIDRMRKTLDFSDCFITHMPEETAGAFWDATVYSPRSGNNIDLPLKQGMATEVYGGYSSQKFAYFFAYRAHDKKGRGSYQFGEVPVNVAEEVKRSPEALVEYASRIAEEKGLTFDGIVRARIMKYQLIETDGHRYYVTGKKEMRNACEMALKMEELIVLDALGKQEEVPADLVKRLCVSIQGKLGLVSPKHKALLSEEGMTKLLALGQGEIRDVLIRITSIVSAQKNMIDLRIIGQGSASGCLHPTYGKEMAKPGFCFVDQSVTGMFEKRQYLEQL